MNTNVTNIQLNIRIFHFMLNKIAGYADVFKELRFVLSVSQLWHGHATNMKRSCHNHETVVPQLWHAENEPEFVLI